MLLWEWVMSVSDADKIDFIGLDPLTGVVVLSISDHLNWAEDNDDHLVSLQDKINAYLSFVESGEIYETFPAAAGKAVNIRIIGKYDLDSEGLKFFRLASNLIKEAGFTLTFEKFEP